ncbi:hypothetical protein [Phaeocystidibacter luteus]|uniref:Outer membrane beta-barrel protein n=1 Tax=Phaeocystidibacter luteus TaxID=911197 RepID=A0A6N6RDJ8_9FLAO|nr:hypothetical protein [Phaeocystidibacter luteus]KAB2807357.1 hypothetical protein F8C67_12330 [Phaeocystidibacter luteus]
MKNSIKLLLLVLVVLGSTDTFAQKKVWVSGAARGVMYGDGFHTGGAEADTVTSRRQESGHTMVDLGVNILPSENIFIQGMVRIRNDYGGFWGSGVTFDVRQLYVKGIIGGVVGYQLGDINYKLSPYTFNNSPALVNSFAGEITSTPLEQIQYDVFYTDDQTWRQQGAAVDFALQFRSIFEEAQFNLFTTRVRPTDFAAFDDRLFGGGSVVLVQSENFRIGGQYANLFDLSGTSDATVFLRNPVATLSTEYGADFGFGRVALAMEAGTSSMYWEGDANAPTLNDYFYDFKLNWNSGVTGWKAEVGYRNVGANFRSPGAQTLRIDYAKNPISYTRYGNDQQVRPLTMLDLSRDASLYQTQISAGLMAYDPRYDNVTPYGVATPNRRGVYGTLGYTGDRSAWNVNVDAAMLQDVVGLGTEALTSYSTAVASAEVKVGQLIGWDSYQLNIGGAYGMQQTSRSGAQAYESIDLGTQFSSFNVKATLVGDLSVIGEYRIWSSQGSTLLEERDDYTQIIDFIEYDTDYSEHIAGAGLLYEFTDASALRVMYQTANWEDNTGSSLPYHMNTWTIYFTMKF